MEEANSLSLIDHFQAVADPRIERTKAHDVLDVRVIVACAVICGVRDWVDIAGWGTEKLTWLRQFLALENGIPSHDTFGRVFSRRDAAAFEAAFLS